MNELNYSRLNPELQHTLKNLIINFRGVPYLPVSGRIAWFRSEHPNGRIETELQYFNPENGIALFRATVYDENGNLLAMASKMESREHFTDFVEKAETGAVGRALAIAGYGLFNAPELGETVQQTDKPTVSNTARPYPRPAPPRNNK